MLPPSVGLTAIEVSLCGPGVASHLESYRHVKLFSPWRYNIDPAARRLLEANGWTPPAQDELPTAGDVVDRYLGPLAALPPIANAVRFSNRVQDISREGFDKVKSSGRDEPEVKAWLERRYGWTSTRQVTRRDYDAVCKAIEAPRPCRFAK